MGIEGALLYLRGPGAATVSRSWGGGGVGGGGARVWAGAKDGQLGNNFKGFWAGDFCCQSWAIQASVFHIVYQATGLFRFPRVPLPPATRPGLVVTCWFKNSSREENDCQLPPRCRMLSPGPARDSTRLRALDSATGAAEGPGPLIGVQSRAGEADRRARSALAPAAGPRSSHAATVSGSSASLGGSL